MKLTFIRIILLFIGMIPVSAQKPLPLKDTLTAYRYFTEGRCFWIEDQFEKALQSYLKAEKAYHKVKHWEGVARSDNHISKVYRQIFNYQESLEFGQRALKICQSHLYKNKQEIEACTNIGINYNNISKIPSSNFYLNKALNLIEEYNLTENRSNIFQQIVYNHIDVKKFKLAEIIAIKALKEALIIKDVKPIILGNAYFTLGRVYKAKSNLVLAKKYFLKSSEVNLTNKNYLNLATDFYYLGLVAKREGDFTKSAALHHKSIEYCKKNNFAHNLHKTYNLKCLAVLYKKQQKFSKALHYLEQALEIRINILGHNHFQLFHIYNDIGTVKFCQKKYSEALIYYNKAIELSNIYNSISVYHGSIAKSNKAEALIKLNKFDEALSLIDSVLARRKKLFGSNDYRISICYPYYGLLYRKKKEWNTAISFYSIALNHFSKQYGSSHQETLNIINTLADIYHEQGNFQTALERYQQALKQNLDNPKNKQKVNFYYPSTALTTMMGIANVYKSRYQQHCQLSDLLQAKATYQKGDQILNLLLANSTSETDKIELAQQNQEVYAKAIALEQLIADHKNAVDADHMFYLAEKNKAILLKGMIHHSQAKRMGVIPQKIVDNEQEINAKLSYLKSEKFRVSSLKNKIASDSTTLYDLDTQLFNLKRSRDSLQEVMAKEYPEYLQFQQNKALATLPQIQERLDDQTALLEFFVYRNQVYSFLLTDKTIKIQQATIHNLEQRVTELNQSITQLNNRQFTRRSFTLYQQLLQPVLCHVSAPNLIIIPDGALWHLNFDTLLTAANTNQNPRDFAYLAKKHTISYANSATNWLSQHQNTSQPRAYGKDCLAFSYTQGSPVPEESSSSMSLEILRNTKKDLPGTRKEIREIANLVNGDYFYGKEAVKTNFKKHAKGYKILHLAVHGEVDPKEPDHSRLYFSKATDSLEDNQLYMHELTAMHLPAELAVLSACNTGNGKINQGEGIMSLGKAFQYAGTQSLVVSNWEISDQTTPDIMKAFYANLTRGMNKAKALQQAKLQFLKNTDPKYSAPFYWAGFYLVGNTAPITLTPVKSSLSVFYIVAVLIVLLLIFAMLYKTARSARF